MMADIRRLPDGLHRRRSHPHMETHHNKLSIAYIFPISINGVSPVETQNLASPVLPMPTFAHNKPLTITAYPPSRDAKSCVSRPAHTNTLMQQTADNNSIYPLVRRKILRLYFCRLRISSLNPDFPTPRCPPCAATALKAHVSKLYFHGFALHSRLHTSMCE